MKKVFLGRPNATFRYFCHVFVEAICSPVIFAGLNNPNCKFVSKPYSHLQGLHLAEKSTVGSKAIQMLVGL